MTSVYREHLGRSLRDSALTVRYTPVCNHDLFSLLNSSRDPVDCTTNADDDCGLLLSLLAVCIPVPTESIDRSTAGLESDRIYPGRVGEYSSQTVSRAMTDVA